jgi:hypothetical protein
MLKANWNCEQRYIAGKLVSIPRGSFIARRSDLARECKVTIEQLRTVENHLKNDPGDGVFLTIKRTHKGMLYTIVKYDFYQNEQNEIPITPTVCPQSDPNPIPNLLYKKIKEDQERRSEEQTSFAFPSKASEGKPEKAKKAKNPNPVLLLRYYYDQMVARHGVKPVVAFGGRDHAIATTVLRGRTLDDAKKLVDAYLDENGKVREEGWPWSWLPGRAAKLQNPSLKFHDIPDVLE